MKSGTFIGVMVCGAILGGILQAAPISDLRDTGTTGWVVSGGLCPPDAATCVSGGVFAAGSPVFIPVDPATTKPSNPDPPLEEFWNATGGGGFWIVPAVREDGTQNDLNFGNDQILVFGTTFTIGAFDSALISGEYWADGRLNSPLTGTTDGLGYTRNDCGIYLNGVCVYDASVPNPSTYAGPSGSGNPLGNPFTITEGFQVGTNTLQFVVHSSAWEAGLRVTQVGAFEQSEEPEVIPEPATYALIGLGLAGLSLWKVRRRK